MIKTKVSNFFEDLFYCIKISMKVALIPVALGLVFSLGYCLASGNPITTYAILRGIRSTGIIFGCFGLFICGLAFLKPETLGPLSYQAEWRTYFVKFDLVGVILCISTLVAFYFLMLDVGIWYIYSRPVQGIIDESARLLFSFVV
jgi:cbb3-type cytochrome oxidase subunit 3